MNRYFSIGNLMLVILFTLNFQLQAQLAQPGTPPGFYQPSAIDIPVFTPPQPDVQRLLAEDLAMDTVKDIPWRFGENIEVNLNPSQTGVWTLLEDGSKLWQLSVYSPGAYSLNLTFDRYKLPPGAELYIYTPDRKHVLGAFTMQNNQDDGWFATTLIPGDEIIIEYFEPAHVAFHGQLNLQMITHAYRDPWSFAKGFGDSGWCNLNVACPQSAGWEDHIRSVVMLVTGGNGFCTGALINNTAFDQRPFVLSANHCFRTPSTVVFWFNWQSATCENPGTPPPYNSMTGAQQRARNTASDFWLMELNQSIPDEFNPYYAGWNRSLEASINETIVGIHHPRGDIKKFSFAEGGVQASSYGGNPGSGTTHWRIVWSGGTTTEPASSGSPIFDAAGRIIGQLHGGGAACGNTLPDWYGRLGISWEGGGTPATRLKDWLDPLNTNLQILNGLDPFGSAVDNPLSFQATPLGPTSVRLTWEANINNDPVVIVSHSNPFMGPVEGPVSIGDTLPGGGNIVFLGQGGEFVNTNLTPQTTYYYEIRSYAFPGPLYSNALEASAQTLCAEILTFPYFEGFNQEVISVCWNQEFINREVLWQTGVGNNDGYPVAPWEGSRNVFFRVLTIPEMGSITRLISPVFNLSAFSQGVLSFYYANPSLVNNQDELRVLYRTHPEEEWVVLQNFQHNQFSWTNVLVDLPQLSDQLQIAFEGVANRGRGISIDHVEILTSFDFDVPNPANLTLSLVDENIAALSWELIYEDSDKQDGGGMNIYRNNELIFAGNDLEQTTFSDGPLPVGSYQWYVKTRLPDGSLSSASNTAEAVIEPGTTTFSLQMIGTGPGITLPPAGTYLYNANSQLLLEAYPEPFAIFSHWIVNGTQAGNDTSLGLLLDADKTVEAVFEAQTHQVILQAHPPEGAKSLHGEGIYHWGDSITIVAEPETGYIFLHWQEEDRIISTRAQTLLKLTRDMSLTAWFAPWDFTLEIEVSPEGAGMVSGSGSYGANSVVHIEAEPLPGWIFNQWKLKEGDQQTPFSDQPQHSFTLQQNTTLVAAFEPFTPTLQVSIEGQGVVDPEPGTYTLGYEDEVTLMAMPAENWKFVRWEINSENIETPLVAFQIVENTQARAVFQDVTFVDEVGIQLTPKIYPVPASRQLTLSLPGENSWKLSLATTAGTIVKETLLPIGQYESHTINVEDLPQGIYLLIMKNDNQLHTARVVISR